MTDIQSEPSDIQSLEVMAAQLAVLSRAVSSLTMTVSEALVEKKFIGPMSLIVEDVAAYTGIKSDQLRGPRRHAHLVNARWTAMYLSSELTAYSLSKIGKFFRRDHTSVIHALRGVEEWKLNNDRRFMHVMALQAGLAPRVAAVLGRD